MSLYAPKRTKADFSLPLHSKDGTSSLRPEGQYSLIKEKKQQSPIQLFLLKPNAHKWEICLRKM